MMNAAAHQLEGQLALTAGDVGEALDRQVINPVLAEGCRSGRITKRPARRQFGRRTITLWKRPAPDGHYGAVDSLIAGRRVIGVKIGDQLAGTLSQTRRENLIFFDEAPVVVFGNNVAKTEPRLFIGARDCESAA